MTAASGRYFHATFTFGLADVHVRIYDRDDGATVVLPLQLAGTLPLHFHGVLHERGTAELDLGCLSPEFVTALGMQGYCVVEGEDRDGVLKCLSGWDDSGILRH